LSGNTVQNQQFVHPVIDSIKHMSSNQIEEGLRLTLEKRVKTEDLAFSVGTARVRVLSTSALILFMEKAVNALIYPYLQEGEEAVSSEINIKHFKPIGENEIIRCIVHLKFVEKNTLFFDVAILDEYHDEVAIGSHVRHVVNMSTFEGLLRNNG
jgi:fluoroacetyl-CoA thioesterase